MDLTHLELMTLALCAGGAGNEATSQYVVRQAKDICKTLGMTEEQMNAEVVLDLYSTVTNV